MKIDRYSKFIFLFVLIYFLIILIIFWLISFVKISWVWLLSICFWVVLLFLFLLCLFCVVFGFVIMLDLVVGLDLDNFDFVCWERFCVGNGVELDVVVCCCWIWLYCLVKFNNYFIIWVFFYFYFGESLYIFIG